MSEQKKYTDKDLIDAVEKERERVRVILEYILNKNSHPMPQGIDYIKAFEEIEDFEHSLIDQF